MKVTVTTTEGVFMDSEQNGIQYRLNDDAAFAEISGSFKNIYQGDIEIPNTVELPNDAGHDFKVNTFEVQGVHLIKVDAPAICIRIPQNVNDIRIEDGCNSSKLGFKVADDNEKYYSDNFCLYTKDMTELVRYYSEDSKIIELPDSVVSIRKGAFAGLDIKKLILPKGIKKVSFEEFGAKRIGEVICKGDVTHVTGNPFVSTPCTLKVNNLMSQIEWTNYRLWDSYNNIRKIITKKPIMDNTNKSKGFVRLHGVPTIDEAMRYHLDYIPVVIGINPDAKFIESYIEEDGSRHIDIGAQWIVEIKEKFVSTYEKDDHNGSLVAFIEKEGKSRSGEVLVFESVGEVQQLISEALCS